MLGRSFRVGRLAGIDVEIHPSWFLILALITWTISDTVFPSQYKGWATWVYWVLGGSAALLLFAAVFVHELAHALVAIRRGLPVPKITLFIFGGVSHLARQPRSAGEEFAVAAAGPATSLAIAAVTGIAAAVFTQITDYGVAILAYLATVNLALAVFNTLPGFPLDGGRVLRSIAWRRTGSFRRATEIAAASGQWVGYGLIGVGAIFLLFGYVLNAIWFFFIGWFLLGAARSEAESVRLDSVLGGLLARDVMDDEFVSVAPEALLQTVVDDQMLGRGERTVVVADDGAVLGILSVSDTRKAPREEWRRTPVSLAMTPRERVITVDGSARALDTLLLLGEHRINQVPVLEGGRMVGIVSRQALIDRLQLVTSLRP